MKKYLIFCLFLSLFLNAKSQIQQNIDFDWYFHLGDEPLAKEMGFNHHDWTLLDVPHDWVIGGKYDSKAPGGSKCGYLNTGIGWYRKEINIPKAWSGKEVSIFFEGIYMNSEIWINGKYLGKRPYGYISFSYNLSKYIKPGKNILAVRVDCSLEPSARWWHGAGIYGHVFLNVTEPLYFTENGIYTYTKALDPGKATIGFSAELTNLKTTDATVSVVSEIFNTKGIKFADKKFTVKALKNDTTIVKGEIEISNPELWSDTNPVLYTIRNKIFDGKKLIEEKESKIGIRTVAFTADKGFLLNGKKVLLRGVCDHTCAAITGMVITGKVLERRLNILKQMGCNAIRTSHYPKTPEFYNACDSLGIMVMDEAFDGWKKKADFDYGMQAFATWWKRDLTDFIRRDRNHPSVVIWSIGNEVGGKSDTYSMTPMIHKLDSSRQVTGGTIFEGVDVSGFNGPGETPNILEKFHATNPNKPIVLTEVPHTLQTRGFYRVTNWWRDNGNSRNEYKPYATKEIFFDGNIHYSSSYDNCGVRMNVRQDLKRTRDTDWISGEFRWTGFDYLGESSQGGGWPMRMFNHGIIDLCGFPKDQYYLYQSQWTTAPMVHILPHWTHPSFTDSIVIPVVAYSNCQEVELFLNGKTLGKKTVSNMLDFVWNVPYVPGELKAIGYNDGKAVAENSYITAENPANIVLTTDNAALKPDRRDYSHLTISVTDSKGVFVPYAENTMFFKVSGPVKTLGYDNGSPNDTTSANVTQKALFYGLAQGIYQSTSQNGNVVVTVAGILGKKLFQTKTTVVIAVKQIALRGSLTNDKFEIRFTTNGDNPTVLSPLYTRPFELNMSTTIKAIVMLNGKLYMTLTETFEKGEAPHIVDYKLQQEGVKMGEFKGPFDKEIFGKWKEGSIIYDFRKDGVMYKLSDYGDFQAAAWWWYDFPNDPFEAPNDPGKGEIRWMENGTTNSFKLDSQKGDYILINKKSNLRRLEKIKNN